MVDGPQARTSNQHLQPAPVAALLQLEIGPLGRPRGRLEPDFARRLQPLNSTAALQHQLTFGQAQHDLLTGG